MTAVIESDWVNMAPTDEVAERVVTLPLFAHMSDDQVELVIESVLQAVDA